MLNSQCIGSLPKAKTVLLKVDELKTSKKLPALYELVKKRMKRRDLISLLIFGAVELNDIAKNRCGDRRFEEKEKDW